MKDAVTLIQEFLNTQEDERLRVAVLGDVMLDEFYQVEVNRLSPEFPIPVMRSDEEAPMTLPGGAANVAYQLSPFNVNCTLFGIGDMRAQKTIQHFCPNFIMTQSGIRTPRKRRFFDQDLPLCRWDVERTPNPDHDGFKDARKYIIERFEKYVRGEDPDVVIMSDYGKGFFHDSMAADLIDICNDYDVPVLVDPKSEPLDQWKGCTIFKPNLKECEQFLSIYNYHPEDVVSKTLDCDVMVVTKGADGVSTYPSGAPHSYYNVPKPVHGHPLGYSGAGDCFAAVYAMAHSLDFDFREASIIANHAASVYVTKKHNAPVTPRELRVHCNARYGKIMSDKGLADHLQSVEGQIVFTNGCFDLLHEGHIQSLEFAKAQGDILVVGVDSDENVKSLKGPDKPIKNLEERAGLLAALECIDFVVPFTGSVHDLIEKLGHINFLVKGGDWDADKVIGADLVDQVIICPRVQGFSTSETIERIKDGSDTRTSS